MRHYNEYHGTATPFTTVVRGGPRTIAKDGNDTRGLFMCYPPPADAMALDCLNAYTAAGEACQKSDKI